MDWIFGLEKNPKIQHILDLELEFKSQWRTWTFDHWIGSKIQVQNFCGPELKWVVKVASAEHFCHRTLAKRAILCLEGTFWFQISDFGAQFNLHIAPTGGGGGIGLGIGIGLQVQKYLRIWSDFSVHFASWNWNPKLGLDFRILRNYACGSWFDPTLL